ncbi:helix-turn-helix domain-containing protein [Variovorax sp. J22R133]|uniref:helix-turn-helix domain-containing protein n=1 Tax=Variovorax brevis TaxID=3053503 RepID=UPI0025770A31|nr:helix-turn-helix domain-containing protein [Variovorax sp. J22R133]MDM0115431.1 helix-turn-helix domain-containing protein [Variovorax sp. J22R133]
MTEGGLQRLHLVSGEFPAQERFERWQASLGGTFNVSVPSGTRPEDSAYDVSIWQFGPVLLSDSVFGPRSQSRTLKNARADQVDHYRLILQTQGELRLDADGRRFRVEAGELVISDMSRAEGYETTRGANIVMFVPREMLDEALPRSVDLHGAVPRGATARMLVDHLRALARVAPELQPQETAALARATVNLLAASLTPSAQTLDHARPTVESTLLRQACRYIDLHLSEPDLSAEALSIFFKVSRSTLYRLFEPLGGVSHYLKERRLARIHAVLSSSGQRQYLGRIAEDHGFKSTTHFSRAFRQQYGYSPHEVRQRGLGAVPESAASRAGQAAFDKWLRSLRD